MYLINYNFYNASVKRLYDFRILLTSQDKLFKMVITSVSHSGSDHFSREGKNLSGVLISGSTFDQPEIGLQHQVRVGLVLVLQRPGSGVRHGVWCLGDGEGG